MQQPDHKYLECDNVSLAQKTLPVVGKPQTFECIWGDAYVKTMVSLTEKSENNIISPIKRKVINIVTTDLYFDTMHWGSTYNGIGEHDKYNDKDPYLDAAGASIL